MKRRAALKNTLLIGGTAAMSSSLMTLLQSCQEQPRLGWEPRFLSIEHARLVSAFVDFLLPATDTPGALDMKVDMFMDLAFAKMYTEEGKNKLVEELNAFNERCRAKFGKTLDQLDTDQKKAIFVAEEAASPKFGGSVWGYPVGEQKPVGFYRSLKSMAIMAYFTSEEIGKNVLNYDPIPGKFVGCIPFSEVGIVWSY